MRSKICLIRHGITEGNQRRLYYGHSDIPLAGEGVDGLMALAKEGIYPDGDDADFYTTGLTRTEQTLFLIYGQRAHKQLENLREINFGIFEMKSYEDLKETEAYQTWIEDQKGELAPPEGESIGAFHRRITKGFAELKQHHAKKVLATGHKEGEALSIVVCHGGTIASIMETLRPGIKDNFFQWVPDPGHGYVLVLEDGEVIDAQEF